MNISVNRPAASRVWFDSDNLWVELSDGRQLAVPLAYFPRLQAAKPKQRERYELSGGGTGIHWDSIDEDISVAGLLAGRGDQTRLSKANQCRKKASRTGVVTSARRKRRAG